MMKKNALLLFCICCFTGTAIQAQTVTNTTILKEAAVTFKLRSNANYTRAMILAKEKNWPLSFTSKKGSLAVLVGVDEFDKPKYYITNNNAIAAATSRANQLWPGGRTGLNLYGSSANLKNRIAVWDGGAVLGTHVELSGKVTVKDNASTNDHSTHVAGTMVANGVNPSAKGMAYGALGILSYDFTADYAEMFVEAPNLLISNHSYSILAGWQYNGTQSRWEFYGDPGEDEDYKFGYYSDDARTLDSIAYNAPNYLIVKAAGNSRDENGPAVGAAYYRRNAQGQMISAGTRPSSISSNDGYDIISWDCGAKNILTVGAVNGLSTGYTRKEDVIMSDFSSWGPTDDGRIKPDIVADGVNLLSSVATSNTSYASFSGTSMAAPSAAGSLFLLQEHYSKLKNSATAFLRSATLKGLAIHTADEAGNAIGPDYRFGWGLLNTERAADVMSAAVSSNNASTSQHQLHENTLTQGQTFTINVVASGKVPLTATICWTDVKGEVVSSTSKLNNRTKMLVNDLDIRITRGSGASLRTYMPWTLEVTNPTADAVRGDNVLDNVERVDVDTATIPGVTYTITVTHKGTLARGSQAYSLLVSGAGGTAVCASNPTSNTGARIETVSFKTINFTNPAGNTTYTDNTRFIADVEPSQVAPIAIKVGSSDGTDQPKMLKVFIDYNNNGNFEAGEQVAASAATILNNATFSANISLPSTLTVGNIYLMRIVLQETGAAANITGCGTYTKGETQDYRVRVVSPANDMTITELISPQGLICGSDSLYVTIGLRNSGTVEQSNIPVSLTAASSSGTQVANVTANYPGIIPAFTTVKYTFQIPVTLAAATTYTLTTTVAAAADQFALNNTLVSVIATAAKPTISAEAAICGTTASLRVINPGTSNYYWYTSATSTQPFATGSTASTSNIPGNNTFYVTREARARIGLPNKTVYTNGGYNAYKGNFMRFNNSVPLLIESARLYIGNAGKIKFTVGTLTEETATGYSYNILSSTIVDAYMTKTNPPTIGSGTTVDDNNPSDNGAIFHLDLPVIPTGDHIINVTLLYPDGTPIPVANTTEGATLFRNSNIAGANTYPIGVPLLASFTGNSVAPSTNPPQQPSQFYYFFYDMKVNTGECVSDRVAVVATTIPTPVITQVGDSLFSSIASGNQWYINDTAISGANGNKYKPTRNGVYKVVIVDAFNCIKTSNTINYVLTAIDPVAAAREINLKVSPNPNNGIFNLSFEVTSKADLSIEILNASGQRMYTNFQTGFVGKFSKQIKVESLSSEVYMLKINHNKKNYVQKIIIHRK